MSTRLRTQRGGEYNVTSVFPGGILNHENLAEQGLPALSGSFAYAMLMANAAVCVPHSPICTLVAVCPMLTTCADWCSHHPLRAVLGQRCHKDFQECKQGDTYGSASRSHGRVCYYRSDHLEGSAVLTFTQPLQRDTMVVVRHCSCGKLRVGPHSGHNAAYHARSLVLYHLAFRGSSDCSACESAKHECLRTCKTYGQQSTLLYSRFGTGIATDNLSKMLVALLVPEKPIGSSCTRRARTWLMFWVP